MVPLFTMDVFSSVDFSLPFVQLYTHSKILVAALNGPVIGKSGIYQSGWSSILTTDTNTGIAAGMCIDHCFRMDELISFGTCSLPGQLRLYLLHGERVAFGAIHFPRSETVFHGPNSLWLTSLSTGLVTEGGSSVSFVNRSKWRASSLLVLTHVGSVGVAKANETLIWGKKQTSRDLLACGFVKYIIVTTSSS